MALYLCSSTMFAITVHSKTENFQKMNLLTIDYDTKVLRLNLARTYVFIDLPKIVIMIAKMHIHTCL